MPDMTAPDEDGIVTVTHRWSNEHGACYDCGAPAAFVAPYIYWNRTERPDAPPPVGRESKFCAVCAANIAADGERIYRLWVDDTDPIVSDEHARALRDLGVIQ